MTSYGVGVSNAFHLLGDDDGAPSSAAPAPAPAAAAAKPAERSNRRHNEAKDGEAPRRNGGGRGGAVGQSGRRGPKREYERHSGTGRSYENKREGKGRYNWGGQGDNEDGESRRMRGRRRPKDHEEAPAEEAPVEEAKAQEPSDEPEVAEEVDSDADKQDLSEYLKQMAELRVVDDTKLSIRRAVDDDDTAQFKPSAALEAASDEEDELLAGTGSAGRKASKRKAGKKKAVLSLDEFTKGQRRGRGGYGGRRGHQAVQDDAVDAVNIDDTSAFPALVSAQ